MKSKEITIIGSGVIGATTALQLAKLGHQISIIDPEINKPIEKTIVVKGWVRTKRGSKNVKEQQSFVIVI